MRLNLDTTSPFRRPCDCHSQEELEASRATDSASRATAYAATELPRSSDRDNDITAGHSPAEPGVGLEPTTYRLQGGTSALTPVVTRAFVRVSCHSERHSHGSVRSFVSWTVSWTIAEPGGRLDPRASHRRNLRERRSAAAAASAVVSHRGLPLQERSRFPARGTSTRRASRGPGVDGVPYRTGLLRPRATTATRRTRSTTVRGRCRQARGWSTPGR
jgi:hypothetical protein